MRNDFYSEINFYEFLDHVHNNKILNFYDEFYKRAVKSKAHSELCRLVYGRDFCQQGMLDMNQLDKLIEVAKLNKDYHVLELGSGTGLITEYISDMSQCQITGIDISAEAIEHASERTKDKRDRIVFETVDMENLNFPENSFDTVISIDTLYYVKDLENTIRNIVKVLKPKGSMYIFYHVDPDVGDAPGSDPVNCSGLGTVLDKLNLKYRTIDFTRENKEHWELKKHVLLQLRNRFEEEDNMFLYNNRMEECMDNLGEYHRFLYIVEQI